MTKAGEFKNAVRRRARDTGVRYTEALAEMTDIAGRLFESFTDVEGLTAHLQSHYGIDVSSVTALGRHTNTVFRVDHRDGEPWFVRLHSPKRPLSRVRGDAEVLRYLARHDYPAERCAPVEDPASMLGDRAVLVTEIVPGAPVLPRQQDATYARMLGDLLGRLHTLSLDTPHAPDRPGGATGHDPLHEGRPGRDIETVTAMLDAIEPDVPKQLRTIERTLRELIDQVDDAEGLPEALLHQDIGGEHVITTHTGDHIVIKWLGAGRGPRLASLAALLWNFGANRDDGARVDAVLDGYGAHVALTTEEAERLRGALMLRPVYYACWRFWSGVTSGRLTTPEDWQPLVTEQLEAIAARATYRLDQGRLA